MMSWWLFVVIFIGCIYILLILWFYVGVQRIPKFVTKNQSPKIRFSIIIAFRNEAKNLPSLLESIARINYPNEKFEILLVDDGSTDNSVKISQDFILNYPKLGIRIVQNERKTASPKKDAITTAIQQSQYEWILTTDADCVLPKDWLQTYATFINENDAVFIAGLVSYQEKIGFLHQFQNLDWMSLVGVSIGSFGWQKPLLCSGANLAYSKQAFQEVKGFYGNDQIASGDDVFLLQKMQQTYPKQVFFLNSKEAIVQTKSESTWQALYQQRIRWAAKTSKIPNQFIIFTGLLVVLTNLLLLILLVASPFVKHAGFTLGIFFLIKLLIDRLLVVKVASILHQKINFLSWFMGSLCYPFFSVSVAFMSLFSSYNWKGRRFLK